MSCTVGWPDAPPSVPLISMTSFESLRNSSFDGPEFAGAWGVPPSTELRKGLDFLLSRLYVALWVSGTITGRSSDMLAAGLVGFDLEPALWNTASRLDHPDDDAGLGSGPGVRTLWPEM